MSPSNMELRIGTIQDYNNEIIVATDAQGLGLNNNQNTKPVPPKQTRLLMEPKQSNLTQNNLIIMQLQKSMQKHIISHRAGLIKLVYLM